MLTSTSHGRLVRLLTVADERLTAEAVAVKGGRIVAVGTRAEVEQRTAVPPRRSSTDAPALFAGILAPGAGVSMMGILARSYDADRTGHPEQVSSAASAGSR